MVLASPGSFARFSNRTLQNTPNMPTNRKHSISQKYTHITATLTCLDRVIRYINKKIIYTWLWWTYLDKRNNVIFDKHVH